MNILFLTLSRITDISKRGIYSDLIRKFGSEGHNVFVVSPYERKYKQPTQLITIDRIKLLKIKSLNIQKTNIIEKGVGTVLLEYQFIFAIKKYFKNIEFDLLIYSTPPITFTKVLSYYKRNRKTVTYLLLKDIFPQNAIDLGLMRENGIIHRFFRKKEQNLYRLSDFIGCMSPANISYLLEKNPSINTTVVEVNPNSVEPLLKKYVSEKQKAEIRKKFKIPSDRTIFIYGGNIGKPQGIDFLIQTLDSNRNNSNAFFVVVGSGTEFPRVKEWYTKNKPNNIIVIDGLPKEEYDKLVTVCDVGMIFLDPRFTIPNFPSRLLSYIEIGKPIIAATDTNTDIGSIAEINKFGFWCKSGDLKQMNINIKRFADNQELIEEMGNNGYNYFLENYTTDHSFQKIIKHFKA